MFVHRFAYHRWDVRLEAGPANRLALFANDCLRKEREDDDHTVLYVWTNLELEWEEHHWIEARLFPRDASGLRVLRVTSNGEPLFDTALASEQLS